MSLADFASQIDPQPSAEAQEKLIYGLTGRLNTSDSSCGDFNLSVMDF